MSTFRLMPANQRELLLDQLDNIAPASDSMVARLFTETLPDPEALLPFVLRRLLELEAEVERLRENARLLALTAPSPSEGGDG